MDISPGDSTPTSEASYSLTGTPTTHGAGGSNQHNDQALPSTTVGLPNALPRLHSHPNASSNMTSSAISAQSTATAMSTATSASMHYASSCGMAGVTMLPATGLLSSGSGGVSSTGVGGSGISSNHRKLDTVTALQHQSHLIAANSPNVSMISRTKLL